MDRSAWIKERRRISQERMDRVWAPVYDEQWGEISPLHRQFLKRLLQVCPPHSRILDAACGTGKYWSEILSSGHTVFGIDQSQGMLDRARARHPDVPVEQIGLQEMAYSEAFDSAVCIDAMESVFPEDWPLVLNNLHRAIKPGGYLYFTVEILSEQEIADAYAAGRAAGLPLEYGEWAPEGRYHFYPAVDQVKEWLQQAGFQLVSEMTADDYRHFLVKTRPV